MNIGEKLNVLFLLLSSPSSKLTRFHSINEHLSLLSTQTSIGFLRCLSLSSVTTQLCALPSQGCQRRNAVMIASTVKSMTGTPHGILWRTPTVRTRTCQNRVLQKPHDPRPLHATRHVTQCQCLRCQLHSLSISRSGRTVHIMSSIPWAYMA